MMTQSERWLLRQGLDPADMCEEVWRSGQVMDSWVQIRLRDDHIKRFGFAVLTEEVVETLAAQIGRETPIVEVGAGSGYWSYELTQAGFNSLPTDPGGGRQFGTYSCFWEVRYMPVESIDAIEAVARYDDRTMLMVWPSYLADWPVEALSAYRGDRFVYVGEARDGCTANDRFFDYLDAHFDLISEIAIPRFFGINDQLFIFDRKDTEIGG